MSAAKHRSPLAASVLPSKPAGPHWRALLEARWRARRQEVTELSLAYATASTPDDAGTPDGAGGYPDARSLLHRAVAARRKLADVEEALTRLTAGTASGNVCLVGGVTPSRALGATHSASGQPSPASMWSASRPSRNSLTARLDLST